MTKQVQVLFRMLLIGILALGVNAQFSATAQTITMTTSKAVGDKISLFILAKGSVKIDGATGRFVNGDVVEYTLTKQSVTIEGELTELHCGNNRLTSLDVTSSTTLTQLTCAVNQLKKLDVSTNTALTKLDCFTNQLENLDLSKNVALTRLLCYKNKLTTLDLSKNAALAYLYCYRNQLKNLDVSSSTGLIKLNCHTNQLESLDISKNIILSELVCYRNQLKSLDLKANTYLESVDCEINQIKGEAMTNLVNSLPASNDSEICVIDTKSPEEGNICTKSQVAIAKGKGWRVTNLEGSLTGKDYEGSDDTSVATIDSKDFNIYPNPAKDFVQIEGAKAAAIVRLYSLDGRLALSSKTDTNGAIRLDISTLATGKYLLMVGSEYSKLVIK